jgi:hypothetical protein
MTDKPSMFLTAEELAELTGIKIGKNKKTREQLQAAELSRMGIPHYVNAGGRVIVVRAILEGGRRQDAPPKETWEPEPWEPNPEPVKLKLLQLKPPPSVASDKDEVIEQYTHAGMLVEIYRAAGRGRPRYFAVVVNPAIKNPTGAVIDASSYAGLRAAAEVRAESKAAAWQRKLARNADSGNAD